MNRKNVSQRATIRTMRQVPLSELLRRGRGKDSLREMARITGLSVTSIKALEDGATDLPKKETVPALAEAYGYPEDVLARAAYGLYYEAEESPLLPQRNPAADREPVLA